MSDELKEKINRIAANHRWEVGNVTLHEGTVYVWAKSGRSSTDASKRESIGRGVGMASRSPATDRGHRMGTSFRRRSIKVSTPTF